MWEDVLIGHEDDCNRVYSAWKLYQVPDGPDISHNQVAYWVTGCVLRTSVKIMKDTPEGVDLTALLKQPDNEALKAWFNALMFRHCDPQKLARILEQALDERFKAGQQAKADEICKVLGL